jgi:hypothetical protein
MSGDHSAKTPDKSRETAPVGAVSSAFADDSRPTLNHEISVDSFPNYAHTQIATVMKNSHFSMLKREQTLSSRTRIVGSIICAADLALSLMTGHAADLTTVTTQAAGSNWNAAIWRTNGVGVAVSPSADNTYQTVFNGTSIGNNTSNTRIRSPASAGLQTFPGDSLTLNTNTELRAKGAGAILNFPGVNGNPGLILNGGMLNGGDDATFQIAGTVQVVSQSYISQGANGGGGGISSARGFNFTGSLAGVGDMVILNAGIIVPQVVSSTSNTFSGRWVVQCGWLLGIGVDGLGTNSIIVDRLYTGYQAAMPNFSAANGGAWFEPDYDLNSAGSLILTNGGAMRLHQNCVFSSVIIEGVPLSPGTHNYSELAASFPNNFTSGGTGTITVQPYGAPPVLPPAPKPYPISANQRGTVYCLENPSISYDIFLPPAYSTNGPPLPIIYTFNPSGGGMVSSFQTVCSSMNIICVGIMGSINNAGWDIVMRESAPVTRDIRHRVLFDPTAEFASGLSGGGLVSYMFSRFRAQHVAGVFDMAGWLGRGGGYPTYQTTDRVLTNLLVARASGLSDGGNWTLPLDSNYLSSCGAIVQDWYFSGGHETAPDSVKTDALNWLLSHRIPAGPNDQSNSLAQATDWRSRAAAGQSEAVLRECVAALMSHPRSWSALEAELVLDDLMLDYDSFRPLAVDNLAQGDFASDLFYYLARGAGDGSDWPRYRSALKALTGITGVNGDRAGDIRDLLLKYSYPAPMLRCSMDADLGQMNLWFSKDTPGLDCFLEECTNLVTDPWQQLVLPVLDTNTVWSTEFDLPPDSKNGFYRLRTTPSAGTSPPWPPQ